MQQDNVSDGDFATRLVDLEPYRRRHPSLDPEKRLEYRGRGTSRLAGIWLHSPSSTWRLADHACRHTQDCPTTLWILWFISLYGRSTIIQRSRSFSSSVWWSVLQTIVCPFMEQPKEYNIIEPFKDSCTRKHFTPIPVATSVASRANYAGTKIG